MSRYDAWKIGLNEIDRPDCTTCGDAGCDECEPAYEQPRLHKQRMAGEVRRPAGVPPTEHVESPARCG